MGRLVAIICFFIGLSVVLNFKDFQKIEPDNTRFSFKETKIANQKKVEELAALEKARHERDMKKADVVEVATGPLVELTTDQLKRGANLFNKCMVCHGKAGQGKKSQKAPAIAGQHEWYIESSLVKMQSLERENKVMLPYIKKLSAQDLKDLAHYISKIPWQK